jgi:hypothetical protein
MLSDSDKLALQYFTEGLIVTLLVIMNLNFFTEVPFDFSKNLWYVVCMGWLLGLLKAMIIDLTEIVRSVYYGSN